MRIFARRAATGLDSPRTPHGASLPELPFPKLAPLEVDPPLHREYRRLINDLFSPTSVQIREPEIRKIAQELMRPLTAARRFDYSQEFATPFSQNVALGVRRVPRQRP